MKGFSTKAIHSDFLSKDPYGSLNMPVYDNVSFEFDSSEEIEKAFTGKIQKHMYSRISNPSVEYFENQVKLLCNAGGVLALSSGMAAISNLMIALLQSGDNIITTKHLFGNTYSLFDKTLKPWGLETKYCDLIDLSELENLIDEKTRAIFFETITNPQLEIADIEALAKITENHKLLLIADSTLTPLYFCDFKKLGVNVELISSTKYISGGATSVGGIIIDYGNYDFKMLPKLADYSEKFGDKALISKLKKESYRNLGACLSAHSAFLQSVGLQTLALRVEKSSSNALAIADFLENHKKVTNVNFPGLKSSKFHKTTFKQFGTKYCGLITFELDSKEKCFSFMDSLKLIRRATNFNDNKSLIIHPASTIYSEYTPALKNEMGVSEKMLRLSVGIEDVEDIFEDIKRALDAI